MGLLAVQPAGPEPDEAILSKIQETGCFQVLLNQSVLLRPVESGGAARNLSAPAATGSSTVVRKSASARYADLLVNMDQIHMRSEPVLYLVAYSLARQHCFRAEGRIGLSEHLVESAPDTLDVDLQRGPMHFRFAFAPCLFAQKCPVKDVVLHRNSDLAGRSRNPVPRQEIKYNRFGRRDDDPVVARAVDEEALQHPFPGQAPVAKMRAGVDNPDRWAAHRHLGALRQHDIDLLADQKSAINHRKCTAPRVARLGALPRFRHRGAR